MHLYFRILSLLCPLVMAGIAAGTSQAQAEQQNAKRQNSVFAEPAIHQQIQLASMAMQEKDLDKARQILTNALRLNPDHPDLLLAMALYEAQINEHDQALIHLEQALDNGLPTPRQEQKIVLPPVMQTDPRYLALLSKRPPAPPLPRAKPLAVVDQRAPVLNENTRWDNQAQVLRTAFRFSANPSTRDADTHDDRAGHILAGWVRRGHAAGNHGDLYDNRDKGHSRLDPAQFPQLSFTEYGPDAQQAGLNYALNNYLLFDHITLGNSSTAVAGGVNWRSLPRLALTQTGGAQRFFRQYVSNHIYVFPEHRDHDPENGDVFPANTPYVLISQGSSGSDRPILRAVANMLAALRPEVKDALREKSMITPTIQMLFRRNRTGHLSASEYMSGTAHPSVFDPAQINLEHLVHAAHALKLDDIPPMVLLSVQEETADDQAILGDGLSERLFDTPGAIARLARGPAYLREMRVRADTAPNMNNDFLRLHWRVLRGDKNRISIETTRNGREAILRIPWHVAKPVPGHPDLISDRVDIGVFVDNGKHISAPAFISMVFPRDQQRSFTPDGKIAAIDYQTPGSKIYMDPTLFPLRAWSDTYHYTSDGTLTGWTRQIGGKSEEFTADGAHILERDPQGRVLKAEIMAYPLEKGPGPRPMVVPTPTGRVLTYRYDGPDDTQGTVTTTETAPQPSDQDQPKSESD